MTKFTTLLCGTALSLICASAALAEATPPAGVNATGTEGTDVSTIVVTAESNSAAVAAPSKASILETQPESLITHKFIEQATPESGDYTTAIMIAPSVATVSAIGGGIGDASISTLRGFQDGNFNITFDGIAFGDANDTTHHPSAFFPGSTIGTAVVDRGPGAAGDMGQANFGGAIHLFSPHVDDQFSVSQKATFGSFNTKSFVTTLQTGAISDLGGARLLLSADLRSSDGQTTSSGGMGRNFLAKLVVPLGSDATLTAFSSINHIRYNQADSGGTFIGFGITADQKAAYGINFALNNDPTDEHYAGYNYVNKNTSFNYLNLKWNVGHGLSIEDHAYYYYYDNQTVSAQSVSDLLNPATDVGTSYISTDGGSTFNSDIAGYHKQNKYSTYGNILRVNQDLGFGTLRAGGLYEHSKATRFISNWDFTTGAPDLSTTSAYGSQEDQNGNPTNYLYYEPSSWDQYQLFADFEYRPLDNLTITPGIKQLHYTRDIAAQIDKFGPAIGSRTYNKTMWFITANYRITPNWSVYGQAATGFLIPPVKTLTPKFGTTAPTAPQTTTTYQGGTVYTKGRLTLDADYYYIDANNVLVNKSKKAPCFCYVNTGKGRYYGWEAQGAFNLGLGLTAFANGSRNISRDLTGGSDYTNAPKSTAALGLIYDNRSWQATISDKYVGPQLGSDGATRISPYSSVDASVSYDFGHIKLKLAVFNLADKRSLLDTDGQFYVYEVGRQVQGTIQAKF